MFIFRDVVRIHIRTSPSIVTIEVAIGKRKTEFSRNNPCASAVARRHDGSRFHHEADGDRKEACSIRVHITLSAEAA